MNLQNMNLPLVFFDHQWSSTISEAGALDRVFCALFVGHGTHVVSEKNIKILDQAITQNQLESPYYVLNAGLHNVT